MPKITYPELMRGNGNRWRHYLNTAQIRPSFMFRISTLRQFHFETAHVVPLRFRVYEHLLVLGYSLQLSIAPTAPVLLRKRALSLLDLWAAVLPIRIANEEIGDCMEDVNRRIAEGQGAFRVGLRVASAIVWSGLNAIGYAMKLLGKRNGV